MSGGSTWDRDWIWARGRNRFAACRKLGDYSENKAWHRPILTPNIPMLLFDYIKLIVNLPRAGKPLHLKQHYFRVKLLNVNFPSFEHWR